MKAPEEWGVNEEALLRESTSLLACLLSSSEQGAKEACVRAITGHAEYDLEVFTAMTAMPGACLAPFLPLFISVAADTSKHTTKASATSPGSEEIDWNIFSADALDSSTVESDYLSLFEEHSQVIGLAPVVLSPLSAC